MGTTIADGQIVVHDPRTGAVHELAVKDEQTDTWYVSDEYLLQPAGEKQAFFVGFTAGMGVCLIAIIALAILLL